MNVVGVLLAAGRSERFGGDKLIAPLRHSDGDVEAGTPLGVAACRHLVVALVEAIAVVRPSDAVLADLLASTGARVIRCANANDGMGASLACGVRATSDADGWVVALADMPWIRPATIKALADALAKGADIIAPSYRGTRGHPVGFSKRHYAQLVALRGDEGARAIVAANRAGVDLVATDDAAVVRDVDTPAQLDG